MTGVLANCLLSEQDNIINTTLKFQNS